MTKLTEDVTKYEFQEINIQFCSIPFDSNFQDKKLSRVHGWENGRSLIES